MSFLASKSSSIATKAEALAMPFAEELGLNLWDVRFVKEGAEWYLRFFIDKEGGVNINDCENLSRALDGPLDEADFIEQGYYLEVSSPGLNRELTKDRHFVQMEGEPVLVKLYRAIDGKKEFAGILLEKKDDTLTITDEDEQLLTFQFSDIASVRLDDDDFFDFE
jgi:ribosome maturation factor RimP